MLLLLPDYQIDPRCELGLFLADRAQHVPEILKVLLEGTIVICDRYFDSTFAYQAGAVGFDLTTIRGLNAFFSQDLMPDLTILLDLDPVIGLKRCSGESRFDQLALEYHQKVREGYLLVAAEEPKRIIVVDASQNETQVHQGIWQIVSAKIQQAQQQGRLVRDGHHQFRQTRS